MSFGAVSSAGEIVDRERNPQAPPKKNPSLPRSLVLRAGRFTRRGKGYIYILWPGVLCLRVR